MYHPSTLSPKIVSLDRLLSLRARLRREGAKVVFTNGCFDLLHRGHVVCLEQARGLGDVLIVGLNSDASIRCLKGDGRPIFPQDDRAVLLAALQAVDYVCLFDEETPIRLVEALRPDVLVKGGDYASDEVIGREIVLSYGGEVRTVEKVEGYSTTHLLRKIASRAAEVRH